MDIKCLRTFQAVVACGTYAKAADRLGYTQSTVTVHRCQINPSLICCSQHYDKNTSAHDRIQSWAEVTKSIR